MKLFGSMLVAMATLVLLLCHPASAQDPASTIDTQTGRSSPAPGKTTAPADEGWSFDLAPYLWFAGAHGTVGALGRDVSIHASPSDLLSHFDIGLMGVAEARYKRFLLYGDLLWIRISDSHALPFTRRGAVSADARVGQLVWTSNLGYRVLDHEKLKADANVGVRFWHVGEKLNFNPSLLGLSLNPSQNWADIVIGGRVQLPMGEKAAINLLGDVGGWNATAKLDYQFVPLLAYKVKPKWTLLAGYRYLFIDYRASRSFIINTVTSGALIGVRYRVK